MSLQRFHNTCIFCFEGEQRLGTTIATSQQIQSNDTKAVVFCPQIAPSLCYCQIIRNISPSSIHQTKDYLYVIDKKKTTSYIRKHQSAYDGRLSSKLIGCTGLAVIVTVALLVVCSDIQHSAQRKPRRNRKTML